VEVPTTPAGDESSRAMLALGRLAGWLEATPWALAASAALALRYALPSPVPPLRSTTAWLSASADSLSRLATVPPPPQWLPSIMRGWEGAVHSSANDPLAFAAWTLWLFTTTQPYGAASESIAHAHTARLIARVTESREGLVAGIPTRDDRRAALARACAGAHDLATYHTWRKLWISEVEDEARRRLDGLRSLAAERSRILELASAMRAPRHCVALADSLISNPRTTVADAATRMALTFRASQAIVDKFVADGILRETTGRRRDRIYECDAVAKLLASG
jgi:hypothetical protein